MCFTNLVNYEYEVMIHKCFEGHLYLLSVIELSLECKQADYDHTFLTTLNGLREPFTFLLFVILCSQ